MNFSKQFEEEGGFDLVYHWSDDLTVIVEKFNSPGDRADRWAELRGLENPREGHILKAGEPK